MNDQTLNPDKIYKIRNAARLTAAMLAAMELDLFSPLENGPMDTKHLASSLGVNAEKLGPLLYALVFHGLLREEDALFSNTTETAAFFVQGKDTFIGEYYKIWKNNLLAALKTAETIKTGKPQAKYDWRNLPKDKLEELMDGMAADDVARAHWLSSKYDFSECRTLLDAGCGSGRLAIAMTQIHPLLSATVFDFPEVTPITEKAVINANAQDRVKVLSGDLTVDPVPGKYDAAFLNSIIQVISADEARKVINNVGKMVNPGGWLYIFGSGIMQDSRLAPQAAVDINLILINVYDHGQSFTESEHRAWLEEAGFGKIIFNYDKPIIVAQKQLEV